MEKIKVSAYVYFDPVKEADLMNSMRSLIDSRQLSSFATNAIKMVLEDPALFNKALRDKNKPIETREDYFRHINDRLDKIDRTIENLESQIVKLKAFIDLNKMLGIDKKTEYILTEELLIKREVQVVKSNLKIIDSSLDNKHLVNNSINKIEQEAEELAAYTAEHYDGILNEIKKMTTIEKVVQVQPAESLQEEKVENTEKSVEEQLIEKEKTDTSTSTSTDASENLNQNDMNLLGDFFGE